MGNTERNEWTKFPEEKLEFDESPKAEGTYDVDTGFIFCPRCGQVIMGGDVNSFCPQCKYRFCPSCSE